MILQSSTDRIISTIIAIVIFGGLYAVISKYKQENTHTENFINSYIKGDKECIESIGNYIICSDKIVVVDNKKIIKKMNIQEILNLEEKLIFVMKDNTENKVFFFFKEDMEKFKRFLQRLEYPLDISIENKTQKNIQ